VKKESDVKNMIEISVERFGRIDCLFNNAGASGPISGIEEINLADVNAFKMLLFNFSVGLKAQSTRCDISRQGRVFKRLKSGI
jgi:NADP-dependent 3-hydroxy acid dehydrogenase YdfG